MRRAWQTAVRMMSTQGGGKPMEELISQRIHESLKPSELTIANESHLHRHHSAMRGVESSETHFRVRIVAEAFGGKTMVQRHRQIYGLLDEALKMQGGIHALALETRTPAEVEQRKVAGNK